MLSAIVLWIVGIGFLVFGGWAFAAPASLASIIGFELTSNAAITEFRAFYGGLDLALGAFFILCAVKRRYQRIGLIAGALCMGALASARIAGVLIDGGDAVTNWALATEVFGFALLLLALKQHATPS